MKARFLGFLFILIMALALVPAVSAQDDPGCFGLSTEDCELIDSASANTFATVGSFYQDFSIDLTVTGLSSIAAFLPPEAGITGDIQFNLTGSGPFFFTPDSTDPARFSADMNVNATVGADSISSNIVATLIDGVLYLDIDGEAIGIPLAETAEELEDLAATNPSNLAELLEIEPGDLAIAGASTDMPPSFADLIKYTRDGDVYTFSLDIGGVLATEDFAMLLPMVLSLAGDEAGLGDLSGMTEMLPDLVAALVSEVTVVQRVDPAANLVTGVTFAFNLEFDLGAAAGSPGAFPPIVIDLVFNVDLSQVNESFEVVAPEGAEMVDPDEMDFALPFGG